MKELTYSIQINRSQMSVFEKIMDKSVYTQWAQPWGPDMTFDGDYKVGGNVWFHDKQGGTKVVIDDIDTPNAIKMTHVAMVDPEGNELEDTDETTKKWIGTKEVYKFTKDGEDKTTLEVVMTLDEAFQEMSDGAWPKALELFKEICEK